MSERTQLLGCYPKDQELEARILQHEARMGLTDEQMSEFVKISKSDPYVQLLATREVLNQIQAENMEERRLKRQKSELRENQEAGKILKIVDDVHTELRCCLLGSCKLGCNSTVANMALDLIQKMRNDIFRRCNQVLEEAESDE